MGDTINGLTTFNYPFLSAVQPSDGLAYNVVIAVRVISALYTFAAALALIYFIFDSGILTSTVGLTMVGLGAALTRRDVPVTLLE